MSLSRKLAEVRLAQARVRQARTDVGVPVDALLGRVREYPLTSVGAVAGAGVVMAQLDVHPLRVPGVGGLFSSGMLELVAQGVRLLADSGLMPFGEDGGAPADPADAP